jgi:GTPase
MTSTNTTAISERGLLRFITAGSVDDGKSTLIGRFTVRQQRDFCGSAGCDFPCKTNVLLVTPSICLC